MSDRVRRAAPVAVVLALLAAVSGVTWTVWGDGSRFAAAMQAADPTPRLPYVEDTRVLVEPPGHVVFQRTGALAKFTGSNVLTPAEMKIAEEGAAVQVESTITREGGITLGVWRFTVQTGQSPWGLFDALDGLYESGNHEAVETAHANVSLRRIDNSFHAHYVRGQDVLRVEGYGENGPAVTERIMKLLNKQVKRSPADSRPA